LVLASTIISNASEGYLREEWRRIADTTDGTIGVAALSLSSETLVSLNGDERFPLASVCKIPIALNILALVDEGKLRLNQQIEVLPRDVWSGVSDLEKRWPVQRHFRLDEMIELMVSKSDNTAVETLFRIGGGGQAMEARFREWRIDGVRVDRSERQCALDRNGVVHYPPPTESNDTLLRDLMEKFLPLKSIGRQFVTWPTRAIREPPMERYGYWPTRQDLQNEQIERSLKGVWFAIIKLDI
jgi:beta-lactamase class A